MEKKAGLGLESYEISLKTARERVVEYGDEMSVLIANYNTKYPDAKIDVNFAKAFWLPVSDIENLITLAKEKSIPDVDGVRLYLGIELDEDGKQKLTMSINLTQGDGQYKHTDYINKDDEQHPGIYDFSQACPVICDVESPLYYEPKIKEPKGGHKK